MADITDLAMRRRASDRDAADGVVPGLKAGGTRVPLRHVAAGQWRTLAARAKEPNAYYLADWELAVNATSPGRTGATALLAWSRASQLIGLLPVVSLRRACQIPLPALVSADPYGTLCTPLLDRRAAHDAAAELMRQARQEGAHALILRDMSLEGPVMQAFTEKLRQAGLRPRLMRSHRRACLDATRDADDLLRDALGAKKLKELRRQRHRLAEHGAVRFEVARSPEEVVAAIETFLTLEASGWKGERGTALAQVAGDAAFIRRATRALAEKAQCEIVTLHAGDTPVAAGIVLRHQTRAFFFKLGVDETFAKFSPGVQLTLDLTRHLCADPAITSADSTAGPGHPMINPIWRGRLAVGDVLIPLRRNDPVVALIHAALMLRQGALELARRGVRRLRELRRRR